MHEILLQFTFYILFMIQAIDLKDLLQWNEIAKVISIKLESMSIIIIFDADCEMVQKLHIDANKCDWKPKLTQEKNGKINLPKPAHMRRYSLKEEKHIKGISHFHFGFFVASFFLCVSERVNEWFIFFSVIYWTSNYIASIWFMWVWLKRTHSGNEKVEISHSNYITAGRTREKERESARERIWCMDNFYSIFCREWKRKVGQWLRFRKYKMPLMCIVWSAPHTIHHH